MPAHNRKLPDDGKLARDMASGMTTAEIAKRYKCSIDHLSRRLSKIEPVTAGPASETLACGIPYVVIPKKVTAAEFGGTIIQHISLPRISMHLAVLEGRQGLS